MNTLRLDRLLSNATGLSRSQVQKAIRAGVVTIDDAVVVDPSRHVAASARVAFDGEPVVIAGPQYLMLHKPLGYVCASHDRLHRTVLELVEAPPGVELHVVGRLDIDATGLVLLTDDGAWLHRITSPRHKVPKVYRVTLAEPLGAHGVAMVERGVQLKDEPKPCAPATLERIADCEWRLTITEGKYHQVKRMFVAVGNQVLALHRERIGTLALDPALAPGAARALNAVEIASFGPGG
jgi:16S rRNA pseudouridine516 synthase